MRISHHIEQGITELLLQTAKMNQGGKKRDSIFKLSNKKGKEETTSRMKWEKKSQLCYLTLHPYLILRELKKPSKVRLD